jgi:hypothetical protein
MGKKSIIEYDLEDDEAFERYLQVISANIFDVIEEIEEIE